MLADYCAVMKLKSPNLQHIVGYATEPLDAERRSEDLVNLNAADWTETDAEAARDIQRKTGILTSPKATNVRDMEYPILPARR